MDVILQMSFCLGNIIGPSYRSPSWAPIYTSAKIAIVVTGFIAIATMLLLWCKYRHENLKRNRDGDTVVHVLDL
jgi:hypothetical protein